MTIALDHAAVRVTVGEIHRAVAVLGEEHAAISRQMAALLQGWTGVAAEAFAEGWADWQRGALEVLVALQTLGRLVDGVHDDLSRRDAESQGSLDAIAGGIPDRISIRLG